MPQLSTGAVVNYRQIPASVFFIWRMTMPSDRTNKQTLYIGIAFIVAGVLFLLHNAHLVNFTFIFNNFWPLLLITIGLVIVYKSYYKSNSRGNHFSFGDRLEYVADDYVVSSHTFGDFKVLLNSQRFKGGTLQTTFGELHVDLTEIKPDAGRHVLNLNVTFGDIAINLPPELPVRIAATNVAGDIHLFEQKWGGLNQRVTWQSKTCDSADTTLDIACHIVFGDIKVW